MENRRKASFEAFKAAWKDYPSQDNEGYIPDRAGFKCGWYAGVEWADDTRYPTVHAYEKACEALHKWRNLCEELELALRMTATPENLVHTVHPRCYCSPCIQKEVLAKYEAMKKGE